MKIFMGFLLALALALALSACATAPSAARVETMLRDDLFTAPSVPINADAVFAISPAMTQYVNHEIADQLRKFGKARGLYEALYSKRQLQLEYDAAITRTAAEAFAVRRGNCLSLVIMTGTLAKAVGLSVRYQSVLTDEDWMRAGDLFLTSGHVNLMLGRYYDDPLPRLSLAPTLIIDFLPLAAADVTRGFPIDETTVMAMYMNNRAAETLAAGRVNDAYWWAREAILRDAKFLAAYNTLGVIYRRHGDTAAAETVLRYVLARDSGHVQAMSNLRLVLQDQGRTAEAQQLGEMLARKQPYPPYHFYDLAQIAMQEKNYQLARGLFAREVRRQPYNADFHSGLASAYMALGDAATALRHFVIAYDTSTTRKQQALYAAKVEKIQALK